MFNNKKLEVRLVKSKQEKPYDQLPADIRLEDKAAIIGNHLGKLVDKVGRVALSYIVLDTARKVIVTYVAKQP